jgi:hypothetical protein
MGEAKRRRAYSQREREFAEKIEAEGQGIWRIMIYGPADVANQAALALAGDMDARKVVFSLQYMKRNVLDPHTPGVCLTCDKPFSARFMPMAWVVLQAHRDDARKMMGNGICADCYARWPGAALNPIVADVLRKEFFSHMEVLPPLSEPGHA